MAYLCYGNAMTRTRISTTVDQDLLEDARSTGAGANDAELIDAALASLLAHYRRVDTDERYARAYTDHPPDEPDEWGDLASFRDAASAT